MGRFWSGWYFYPVGERIPVPIAPVFFLESIRGLPLHLSPFLLALAVSLAALFSIGGDLMASGMKRDFQIKDYSHLIPGHGGILDRFDSVLFTAPIIYYGITVLDYFKKI